MFNFTSPELLSLFILAVLIATMIYLPSIVIALQEIQIEGPFGWSSLTFTKRFPIDHPFSKIFRALVGQDKWATHYHLYSSIIWLLMFTLSLLLFPVYFHFSQTFSGKALVDIIIIALCAFTITIVTEDHYWFNLHPYYGMDKYNKHFIPWFQSFIKGVPVTYWIALLVTIVLIGITSWLQRNPKLLILWAMVICLVFVASIGLRIYGKHKSRLPIREHWWEGVQGVYIERCPYPVEGKGPFTEARVFVVMPDGEKIPLNDYLAKGQD